jgi:hypothetical protein
MPKPTIILVNGPSTDRSSLKCYRISLRNNRFRIVNHQSD